MWVDGDTVCTVVAFHAKDVSSLPLDQADDWLHDPDKITIFSALFAVASFMTEGDPMGTVLASGDTSVSGDSSSSIG